ncbi:MAG: transcriptional regulator, TetR family [Solirubrobacterales bacterium]|nr:transcriptional regulator, TetR family [Solirubrobacterales bacterium]
MARDSAATRERILRAAVDEFSARGLAGARVDRIAAAAPANKRSIYDYFGDKEQLFAAALHVVIGDVAAAVPLTVDDLPGYAGRLFDHLVAHPASWRMGMWLQLERPAAGPDEGTGYAEKIARMTAAGAGGPVAGIGPVDLVVLIIGLARGWFLSPDGLLAADGRDPASPEGRAIHRAAIVEAVRRMCVAAPASASASAPASTTPIPDP